MRNILLVLNVKIFILFGETKGGSPSALFKSAIGYNKNVIVKSLYSE